MAGSNHDTSWQYDTQLTSHADYIVKHLMDLVNALFILAALFIAELFFAFIAF